VKGQAIQTILKLLELCERLKFELRHSWLSNGRRESVAEPAWQMALMAMVLHRHLEHQVDLERSPKMVLIHDLVEVVAGDIPFFETGSRQEAKASREREAIETIRGICVNVAMHTRNRLPGRPRRFLACCLCTW